MQYFQIIVCGRSIYFDNPDSQEAVIGFLARRSLAAEDERLALATVKRDILIHWNQVFNSDRKIGIPKLHIEHVKSLKKVPRRKDPHDYYFFTSETARQEQLDKFSAPPKGWFR